jgi:hypothetical protein
MFKSNRKFNSTLFASSLFFAGSLIVSAQSSTTTIHNAPGQHSQSTTVTGPNGKTASYQSNASWGNGVYSGNKTYTGRNGKTVTESTSRGNGQLTRTFTGRNGQSRTYSRSTRWRR